MWLADGRVHREPSGVDLTWVVAIDGVVTLQRNANNETEFDLSRFGGKTVTVHLKTWVDGRYRGVSDSVAWQR